jgi:tetratricopeptide (TPR) repeat protein
MKPPTVRADDSDPDTGRASYAGWKHAPTDDKPTPVYISAETLKEKECRSSIKENEKQVKRDIRDYYAYNDLALCYARLNQNEKAIEAFKKGLKILEDLEPAGSMPDSSEHISRILYNLGNLYADTERYGEAIDAYTRAIQNNPTFMSAYYNVGIVYSRLGDYQKAIAALREVIKLNKLTGPTRDGEEAIKARYNLGLIYLKTGKRSEAEEQYEALKATGSGNNPKAADLANKLHRLINPS